MATRRRQAPSSTAASQELEQPAASASTFFLPWWAIAAALTCVCVAAYANSFGAGFAFDNRQLILNDPRVHALTGANLARIIEHTYWWPYGESGLYRPLTTFSYLFNFAVLGHADRPAGYHAVNLLLHIANVLMVWRLTWRITASAWAAVATAAIWAVFPLSTEAVTNIVGRADLIAAAGMLASVLLYLRARSGREPLGRGDETGDGDASGWTGPRLALVSASALALLAGVLAKESAVSVLGVFVLIELCWWTPRRSVQRLVGIAVACAIPLALWAWLRYAALTAGGTAEFPFTDNPIVGASFSQGRLTALFVMLRYVALSIWPVHLSNDYSYPQIPLVDDTWTAWFGMLLLLGGAAAALWQMRSERPVLFFVGFAVLTFLPASNLLFATGTIMGERLAYVPSVGLFGIVAIALSWAAARINMRAAISVVVLLIVGAYGARTYARNHDWRDDLTLWRSAVRNAPDSAKAHRAFAEALYASDPTHANIDDVLAEAQTAVDLLNAVPDEKNTFQTFRQAGAFYLDKGATLPDLSDQENQAIKRAIYLRAQRLLDRAVVIARLGASQFPAGSTEPEADAQRLRAVAFLELKDPATALIAANRSRALSPKPSMPYHLAAQALIALHRDMEAAQMLLAGSIVSGDPELGQEAMKLYTNGLDSDGCAVTGSGASAALNPQCPIVLQHSCVASAAAYQILARDNQIARAQQVRDTAISTLHCPAELMDRPNGLVP